GLSAWDDIQKALGLGIWDLAFDFRPTSLNFLPTHQFLDFCKRLNGYPVRIYGLFENESPLVLQKFLEIIQEIGQRSDCTFSFEFIGLPPAEGLDFTSQKMYWQATAQTPLTELSLWDGIVLDL